MNTLIRLSRKRNRGHGRTIVPQQRVHASVAFIDSSYRPSASFAGDKVTKWEHLIGEGRVEDLSWVDQWQDILDIDVYDGHVQDTIHELMHMIQKPTYTTYYLDYLEPGPVVRLLRRLSFMALSDRGARRISGVIYHLVDMLSAYSDNIKAESAYCLFQLAKHKYLSWILKDCAQKGLEKMLYGNAHEARVASLQCLSQMVLVIDNMQHDKVERRDIFCAAQEILMAQPNSWVPVLYELLHSLVLGKRVIAVSCLAYLVQDDRIRGVWIENIKGIQQEGSSISSNLLDFVTRIIHLLTESRTEFHAAVVLGSVVDDIHDTPFEKRWMVSRLKCMIAKGHGKTKGAAVLCLSKFSEQDAESRKYILDEDYIATLVLQLFSKRDHCCSCDVESVSGAFLTIAERASDLERRKAIHRFSEVLCVDKWLPEGEGCDLLYKLLSSSTLSSEAQKFSIERLVTIGRDCCQDPDGTALRRMQVVFNALCENDRRRSLIRKKSVLQTIFWALKCRNEHTRDNAIVFLDSVCTRSLGPRHNWISESDPDLASAPDPDEVRKLMCSRLSDLLDCVAKLGKKNIKQRKSVLASVRKALEVFCHYEEFQDQLLDPAVLSVISKGIDLKTANMYKGHGVLAQISGVECWQELMKYDWARVAMFEKGVVNHLLDIYRALREEPESCQWLRLWPDYDRLLLETFEKLVKYPDVWEMDEVKSSSDLFNKLIAFIITTPYRIRQDMPPINPPP
ncbi:uncharacterized protein EV420DRAFT_1560698 [Desarmillaria tabescens]|uniref:Uncharacterized protein n=1 Tax=Armillaria tabescens TaxID=1929756 RepID=A0AA39K0V4_ARMTA|nr:uncharacterized protein EV420DRAFT_1560698 [Desarmillaria tabescens]KAK0451380.1 hypothetical protein EV420DRAFT_1560698 [Desarmillaria tabescens]